MPVEHTGARVDPSWMLQAGAGATRPVTSHRAARGGTRRRASHWFAVARGPERALAMVNVFLWGVNLVYVLGYANVLPLIFATRPVRPSRDNFCGELRPRRRRRLSARLMRITSGEPVPTERLATYDDTRQIFAD